MSAIAQVTPSKKYNPFFIWDHIGNAIHNLEQFCEDQRSTDLKWVINNTNKPFESFTLTITTTHKALKEKRFDHHLYCTIGKYHNSTYTVKTVGGKQTMEIAFTLAVDVMDYQSALVGKLLWQANQLADGMERRIEQENKNWENSTINPSDYMSLSHFQQGVAKIISRKRDSEISITIMQNFIHTIRHSGLVDTSPINEVLFEILAQIPHSNWNDGKTPTRISYGGNIHNLKLLCGAIMKSLITGDENYQIFDGTYGRWVSDNITSITR